MRVRCCPAFRTRVLLRSWSDEMGALSPQRPGRPAAICALPFHSSSKPRHPGRSELRPPVEDLGLDMGII